MPRLWWRSKNEANALVLSAVLEHLCAADGVDWDLVSERPSQRDELGALIGIRREALEEQ